MLIKKQLRFVQQLLSVVALCGILLVQVLPIRAQEAPPPPPPPPPPPTAQEAPPPPPPPPPPPADTPPPAPTAVPQPTITQASPTIAPAPADPSPTSAVSDPAPTTAPVVIASDSNPTPTPVDGVVQNGQTGDTIIATGDADNSGIVISEANTNLAVTPTGTGGGISISNTGNGAGSDNTGSMQISDTNSTTQNNSVSVSNDLNQTSNTGDNSASMNVGNSLIQTGNANVSGTAITSVNTNLAGVSVSEFNIVDDHQGDYVLDFAANCISGCGGNDVTLANTGNGADSTNTTDLTASTTNTTFQNNDATVGNNLILSADSGGNQTNFNTGGDNLITTGDANVSASALTFANNNITGNVVYGVINIYGDLIGDIVFPEEQFGPCCGQNVTVANTDNGAGSVNTANVNTTVTDSTYQSNLANIDNNLVLDADTGSNQTTGNTGGDNLISTGDTSVTASVLNVANSNVSGSTWWLVLVNEAGNWIGKIFGSPDGTNYAGSPGTQFAVGPNGEITAVNSGNGAGSVNTTNVDTATTNTTTQTNTADLNNNLQLSANTGGNSASYNTGGSNGILTGDAQIIANLVNFVNNNITGGGRLVVSVVNVFGSWLGDFVTSGQKKTPNPDLPVTAQSENISNPVSEPAVGGADLQESSAPTTAPAISVLTSQTPSNPGQTATIKSGIRRLLGRKPGVFAIDSESKPDALIASFTAGDLRDVIITPAPSGLSRKIIHINLAWLLLIIPAAGILGLLKLRRLPL
ncbi:TPA: hypothetical protein DCZ90_03305 [Candidatus Amesbacteria bacterium]|nr:hypothetical protein [Candidatus Amesbacteria bacterium]